MNALQELASVYRQQYGWSKQDVRDGLAHATFGYVKQNAVALGDGIAVAVALEMLLAKKEVQLDQLSDQALEAFQTAFPNVPIESLNDASQQQLEGMLNAWKGKLFEIDVRDRLNQGEWVGDWHLEPGQSASLAKSATQPGWDLSIHDDDGSVADVIQLKATDSEGYIREALERYPDIHILATSDVASIADQLDAVSADSVSVQKVAEQITEAVPVDAGYDTTDSVGMITPTSLIVITEGISVWRGKKSLEDALESGGGRVMMAGAAAIVGGAVGLMTGGLLGFFAAIGTRLFLGSKMRESAEPKANNRQLIGDGIIIDGKATRVSDPDEPINSNQSKNQTRSGQFKNLENVSAYLGQRYAPNN